MIAVTTNLSADDRAELNRAWAELTAALRVIERLLGEDDPTGLGYSREDDEAEPAAPVREHYGFTVTGREQRPTNTPAGFASTERRTHQVNGRPGSKLSADGGLGGPAAGMGAALLGGRAALTLRGSGGLR